MEPEDWNAVSRIYLEGIATEHATFQTNCPPYTAWDASHTKDCRLVVLDGGVIAGWTALHRVDPRWCYRGVVEVSIYVGEQFRGRGLGYHLLTALCAAAEQAGFCSGCLVCDGQRAHRIPRLQLNGVGRIGFPLFFGQILLVDDDLVQIFLEPAIRH